AHRIDMGLFDFIKRLVSPPPKRPAPRPPQNVQVRDAQTNYGQVQFPVQLNYPPPAAPPARTPPSPPPVVRTPPAPPAVKTLNLDAAQFAPISSSDALAQARAST